MDMNMVIMLSRIDVVLSIFEHEDNPNMLVGWSTDMERNGCV